MREDKFGCEHPHLEGPVGGLGEDIWLEVGNKDTKRRETRDTLNQS